MTASVKAFDLIRRFEGLRLEAYQDVVGVWTVGFGTTRGVEPGMVITKEQAEAMLRTEVARIEQMIDGMITAPVTRGQFDACVSFAYNLGCGNLMKSTVLKKVNARDPSAAAEFLRWDRAGGKVLAGLTRRRQAERELFIEVAEVTA
jgi:lysozyme